jgi:hypothetical protein
MKIWYGYGSEHSTNLVMIGKFKHTDDAKKAKAMIDQLTENLTDKIEVGRPQNRFEDDVIDILKKVDIYTLGRSELEQFLYDINTRVDDDKLILTTDESDISAFIKLMIDQGAKVEIFSAHDYPDSEYGRGK